MYSPLDKTLVIGLGHKARHGKDTAAQFFAEAYPGKVMRIGFADALYAYCRVDRGMTTKDAPLLQKVGVEMRAKNPETWVQAAYWNMIDKKPEIAVYTDVRFPNEAEYIRSMGGYLLKVERRMPDGTPYKPTDRDPLHISETALDDFQWDKTISILDGDMISLREESLAAFGRFQCLWQALRRR